VAEWDKEQVATLIKLASEGNKAGQIAKKIGRTRNSVISKLTRCGILWDRQLNQWTDPKAGIFIAGYDGEAICMGANRNSVVYKALRILNEELPEGEPRWTEREVRGMVEQVSPATTCLWNEE
jgi:hypothetical protein